ncbi:hypothetical protein QDY71_02745 [Kingella negevensis]|uniref:Lipoprotein n=1 Tax=Kingella negevensis TaxID=1522312 RepID=A0A238HFM0_9NEIS|nr:hypothetical protein [Kingella negevensis]MDK4679540.1 hypothetical protein [Kingella negevensis]MDK4682742.1 hypothetical protein [Kingella negevensis]MDK4685106.1 hypothetical protein [Kingella negevensis]MDK4690939.1 hypothetical protein [Kingella negevensis]MDK4693914.1 hypothetical protein [Kingella negevensis]
MKKVTLCLVLGALLGLAACDQRPNGSVQKQFAQACVQSALEDHADAASDPRNQETAKQVCGCVYEEGKKNYQGKQSWEEALAVYFATPEKADPKLLRVNDNAIRACVKKLSPKLAASEPKK